MPDWVLHLGAILVTGGAAYGAIRADLKALHDKAHAAHDAAARAHIRMDDHIDRHHIGRGA